MKRYTIYFFVALITFGMGSFAVFSFFISTPKNTNQETKFEMKQIADKWQLVPVKEFSKKKEDSFIHESVYQPERIERKKPFCNDKKLLRVWKLLLKDRYFREQSNLMFRNPNCANMFEVFEIDLNRNGIKEIILRAKSYDLCGATGNCGFWVFEKKGKKYRKILNSSDYGDITEMGEQIQKARTKGYFDIVTKGHFSVSDTRHSTYKFNGRRYVISKYIYDAYVPGTINDPK